MSFSDHKITAFTHKIADLPDQPNLPADELKARFDSSPEELRQSLNAVCDEGDALTARVDQHDTKISQIAMDKFPNDTIEEKNLHHDLAAKLNAKAEQTALSAEAAAREDADDALQTAVSQKCEIYTGTYTGNFSGYSSIPQGAADPLAAVTAWQDINLGFFPKAVLILGYNGTAGYIQANATVVHGVLLTDSQAVYQFDDADQFCPLAQKTNTGFRVCNAHYGNYNLYGALNIDGELYRYIAFK